MLVKKRDGRLQEFDSDKILASIKFAALAVECKDDDIQNRSKQIMNLKQQLMDIGFSPEEAEEKAEEEFDGYIEDGIYTEYDEDEALEVLEIVSESLDNLDEDVVETSIIQEITEKALMDTGHSKTAREYIVKSSNRDRIREMNTALMRVYEDLTFGKAKDVDSKRENANINGESPMGLMLKYGSEGAKKFNLLHLISPDISKAHADGDIHIHDLDFYSITTTCLSADSKLIISDNRHTKLMSAEEVYEKYHDYTGDLRIMCNGELTKIKNIVRNSYEGKQMLNISTKTGNLSVTSEHTVPIIRDGYKIDVAASDIKVGDVLIKPEINTHRFVLKYIDIIDMYSGDNLAIANTNDVLANIKGNGFWKEFCNYFSYKDERALAIRSGHCKLSIKEYRAIQHLCSLRHADLEIAYNRAHENETIGAVVPLTRELGEYIGFMLAEGSIVEFLSLSQESPVKSACFCNYDVSMIERFNKDVESIFNNPVIGERKHNGRLTGTLLSGYLTYELFSGIFAIKKSTANIRLADWTYLANEDFVSGLMAGIIDGDGFVQKDGYRVGVGSIAVDFLKDLQYLMLIRGVDSVIKKISGAEAGSVAHFNNGGIEVESIRKYQTYHLEFTGNLVNKLGWIKSSKIMGSELCKYDKMPYKNLKVLSNEKVEYSGYVYDLETETHYFDANGFVVHNCCQIDLEQLFEKGFSTGHGYLRTPGEIRSYAALACIAIQSNQNDQHGGQSIPNFDYYMAPGVAKSFVKNLYKVLDIKYPENKDTVEYMSNSNIRDELKNYLSKHRLIMNDNGMKVVYELLCTKYSTELDETEASDIVNKAIELTREDTHQAMEALVHNLNSMHSRAGGQVPFSSINFGTDTSEEGRMASFEFLEAINNGLGFGETSIFPVSIFKEKAGVSYNPGDPNYDLWERACEVSAKRLYPNFDNLDAPYNAKYYKEGDRDTEAAYMGCVAGYETITYKINNTLYVEGIGRAWERLKHLGVRDLGISKYVDTEANDVKVWDSNKNDFVKVKKIIINPNRNNWKRLKLSDGRTLTATSDHPLPVVGKGRTLLKDIAVGDKVPVTYSQYCEEHKTPKFRAEVTEITDVDLDACSYDLETESDRFDVSGILSHNCRTRVIANTYNPEYEKVTGRGNLSFTSINLPRLAIISNGDIDKFFELLDSRLELVHRQLKERFAVQCRRHPRNFAFMFGNGIWIGSDKLGPDDDITEVLKNGTLTVGFIGLAECLKALTGQHHGQSEESQKLGLHIVKHMREATDKWSEAEKLNYSLIATPAEGLSGRFVRLDKKRFGIIPGVTDREYYTNSFHVPVYYNITAFKKIDIEAPYHELTNGGHISYIELDGDPTKNIEAFKKIVRYMHDKGIGYGAINHPVDRDPVCGYNGIIDDVCPRCGRKEFEPMTEEMWNKLASMRLLPNIKNSGYCGDMAEEADRIPLEIE